MSEGKMATEELYSALQNCFSRLAVVDVPQDCNSGPKRRCRRTRAYSLSTIRFRSQKAQEFRIKMKPYIVELRHLRSRTKSENETDVPLEPPYSALPIDSMLTSNLFKSRSMESIDAPPSEDITVAQDKEQIPEPLASLSEGNSVLNGLRQLNSLSLYILPPGTKKVNRVTP